MEWKVIFMSQVWQLPIVPSLRYCAALSLIPPQILAVLGVGKLVAFYQFCPFSNVELS